MAQVLKYRIENAQTVTATRAIEFEGQPATVEVRRLSVEALLVEGEGPTLALSLPADAAADFPEGGIITVTIKLTEAPAEPA